MNRFRAHTCIPVTYLIAGSWRTLEFILIVYKQKMVVSYFISSGALPKYSHQQVFGDSAKPRYPKSQSLILITRGGEITRGTVHMSLSALRVSSKPDDIVIKQLLRSNDPVLPETSQLSMTYLLSLLQASKLTPLAGG